MTRLFLRFFVGVIAILLSAWLIQWTVLQIGSARQTIEYTESALGGGARLATQHILEGPVPFELISDDTLAQRLKEVQAVSSYPVSVQAPLPFDLIDNETLGLRLREVQAMFDYPVNIVESWELSLTPREKQRLEAGEIVLDETGMLLSRLSREHVLRLGPLPEFRGPSQRLMISGLGLTMLLAAVAIAILLRPVAMPLRAVERTATAISEGDLSARIDPSIVPKGLALASAFNTMADRSEKLLRSQKELLQAVSHELRTPLARIRFATDLIETAQTEAERRQRLASVDNATQRLDDLVGELLTYVRLESDAPVEQPEPIELNALFEHLIDLHAPLHQGVDFAIERGLPQIKVTADRNALARAVGNLLSNAGRYAHSRVVVRARQRRDGVLIQVDDDGVGIPAGDREKVFEPFVRLTPGDGKGTGLGLALVHRIATRNGGFVVAEESDLGGARFSLHLPLESRA